MRTILTQILVTAAAAIPGIAFLIVATATLA
jgi:hypothetical protein